MIESVLVTGGAGFIGSHTVEALLARDVRVRVLDNFCSGHRENLAAVADRIDLIEGDIREAADLDRALEGVQAVIHLAAEASVPVTVADPLGTHQSNYVGTLNLLEAMRRSGAKRIVYASTAAVYPPESEATHKESDLPDPSSPYGADKLAGETALRVYSKLYGFETQALRFFNIYGERQDPKSPYSGVISIFVSRLMKGEPITIFGDGEQLRDFVYVRDLAGILATIALEKPGWTPLMNVATGRSVSLKELVAALEKVIGVQAEVTFAEPRAGDVKISRAHTGRIEHVGLQPSTPLETGLRALVESLRG